jgi:hypothetical protein
MQKIFQLEKEREAVWADSLGYWVSTHSFQNKRKEKRKTRDGGIQPK